MQRAVKVNISAYVEESNVFMGTIFMTSKKIQKSFQEILVEKGYILAKK